MNAAGDNNMEMNGEAGGSSEQNGERLTNNPSHNDCGKRCDTTLNGARPKVRHLCNIPNGIAANNADDAVKVNNNLPADKTGANLECSTSSGRPTTVTGRTNGLRYNCNNGLEPINGVDSYLRNNVNCCTAVEKCPLKVSDLGSNNVSGSSPPTQTNGHPKFEQLDTRSTGNLRWDDDDSSSSDTGNEGEDGGLSADECCIYTYKGDQLADLPSSFFRLDVGGAEHAGAAAAGRNDAEENNARSSSPEMDFLEMDFDPGPSCEQDSGEDSECGSLRDEEAEFVAEPPRENGNTLEDERNDLSRSNDHGNVSAQTPNTDSSEEHPQATLPSYANQPPNLLPHRTLNCRSADTPNNLTLGQRTTVDVRGHHTTSGDLCTPPGSRPAVQDDSSMDSADGAASASSLLADDGATDSMNSSLYHCIMARRLIGDLLPSPVGHLAQWQNDANPHGRTMIWSEREACDKQVTQISTSACGATAVVNTLVAMNISFSLDRVKEAVGTRLRLDKVPIPAYLVSRSVAGANHLDIIRGLQQASDGAVYARFFHMYPQPAISLTGWLAYWMKKGAVPIATLNLQRGIAPGSLVPDAWHHQMIFGTGPDGVYLSNPLEHVSEATLWPQLASPSELLVRRTDVIERWNQDTDLRPLMRQPDIRWKRLNVLGQVANVVREWTNPSTQAQGHVVTSHVTIPASYASGVTLAIGRESPACDELADAPELV